MTVSATLQAELHTAANVVTPQTVVALPPSALDPDGNTIRVYVGGVLITRQYDPTMAQP